MKAMELMGQAIYDYHKGESKGDLVMVMQDGTRYIDEVKGYFRTSDNFFEIEKILYQNINGGKLLDIGCACGTYIPILEKLADSVEAIDISEKNIQVARERGYINAHIGDIMNYKTDIKYDIITLIGNNLSIGGDIPGTHKLLDILKGLLKENGKILCTFKKTEEKYFIGKMSIEYNKIISEPFQWIRIRLDYLEELLKEHNLKLKVLGEDSYGYCLEITNN